MKIKKDTISLLTLWLELILYFLQKFKVRNHELTGYCDVLILAILMQRVFGGICSKQN